MGDWIDTSVSLDSLATGRRHVKLQGRFVSILSHKGSLFCMDSVCHHAGGPVGEGAIADIEGIPCIKCPWHNFIFALDSGERIIQELRLPQSAPEGAFTPQSQMKYPLEGWPAECLGPAKRTGIHAQRVHEVRVGVSGTIEVRLSKAPEPHLSDGPATDAQRGNLCVSIQESESAMGLTRSPPEPDDTPMGSALPFDSALEIFLATKPSSDNAAPPRVRPINFQLDPDEDNSEPPDARSATPPPHDGTV